MSRLAVLGEQASVQGYALAGAVVVPAADPAEVRAAWDGLPEDVAVVILTPAAAQALGPERTTGLRPLVVVMPP